ncbi:hypothetical protein BGZ83_008514 [Gryganskiella cystojenkinii]|nr:hypothetical protein BGZ83_008514 [Gryganskiella cystojenkinii]
MLASNPAARMVSVANATKLLRSALPRRTFASSPPSSFARNSFFSNNNNIRAAFHNNSCAPPASNFSSSSRFFSSSTARPVFGAITTTAAFSKNAATSSFVKGQATRGYSRHAWHGHGGEATEGGHPHHHHCRGWFGRGRSGHHHGPASSTASATAGAAGEAEKVAAAAFNHWGHHHHHWKHLGRRGYHHDHHHHYRRRRRGRFLFRMMAISTLLVAVPAVMILDAPCETLVYVPLTVAGAGFALMLTGKLLYVFLPLMAIGGAASFWMFSMPAFTTVKDLKKILSRDEKNQKRLSSSSSASSVSALTILGRDWQVQAARPDEWFHWTFPDPKKANEKDLMDKVDVRMAVFDPNDHSRRKEKTMKLIDRIQDDEDEDSRRVVARKWNRRCRKIDENSEIIESLKVKRQGDHFVITIEDEGEKIMDQIWAKKYLQLGQIVDRAATEMERAQPGLKLGNQVVLIHTRSGNSHDEDSFWNRWSPYGNVSLRIPFDRTWVNDLSSIE